jgi:hypothetical protein
VVANVVAFVVSKVVAFMVANKISRERCKYQFAVIIKFK